MAARHLRSDCTTDGTTPAGGYTSGQIVLLPDGRAGVIQGLRDREEGDPYSAATEGVFDVDAQSAATFAAGDVVRFDASSEAVASGGDGSLGVVEVAKAAGETSVRVILNGQGASA